MIVVRHAEPVMGTVFSFVVYGGDLAEISVRAALGRACDGLHEDDATFSTWHADSPMSRVRRGELALRDAPPEMVEVLVACASARELSGGWFDPWAMPGGVDPTGLVKGWAAERAAAELARWGVAAALINAGGDIVTFGQREPGRRRGAGEQARRVAAQGQRPGDPQQRELGTAELQLRHHPRDLCPGAGTGVSCAGRSKDAFDQEASSSNSR